MKKSLIFVFIFLFGRLVLSQSEAQIQALLRHPKLKIEGVQYRRAVWETQQVREEPYAWPNNGGYVFVYFTNVSEKSQRIRNWVMNREEGSRMRLGHKLAWDRLHQSRIEPGQTSVLEICGLSKDFQPGKPFEFAFIGGDWRPSGGIRTTLQEDLVQISFIHIKPGMKDVEVFVRNAGTQPIVCRDLRFVGKKVAGVHWAAVDLPASGITIARAELSEPLTPGELLIAKLRLADADGERIVFAHRRAHEDFFPIGTWGARREDFQYIRRHHVDTIVKGGRSDDDFYAKEAEQFGFRTMVHSGVYPDVDLLRDLGDHPAVAAWMVQDEPDWNRTPQQIFTAVDMTHQYNSSKPTMITLCRNGKFFEFAFLPDIACQDHYSVTAPTSSIWPHRYGARLEETAYYTRDLKRAAEPKPIWVWSQGLANWDERPKRPVPTPDELAAQLLFNLGRGAKGLLWFTFNVKLGERYPEMHAAMQGWGRVLEMIRGDLLAAEPVSCVRQAPPKLDVAVLAGWDKMFIFLVNLDYQIDDEAYPWTPLQDVRLKLSMPEWIAPKKAVELSPDGVIELPMQFDDDGMTLDVGDVSVGKIVVIDRYKVADDYQKLFEKSRAMEDAVFE